MCIPGMLRGVAPGWLYSSKTVTFYDETGAYLDVYTTFRFGVLSSIMRIEPELTSPLLNEEGFWW